MGIIKDLFNYLILFVMFYYFFKCLYLKSELFKQRENYIKTLEHDFRVSLLAQIRGLNIVKQHFKLTQSESAFVEEINNSCKYSLDMVSMLLKIYKIENKDLSLFFENLNISEILSEIFTEYRNLALEKNVKLRCNLENNILHADKESIKKALKILIYTAILYSLKNTTISIFLKRMYGYFLFEIKYNGKPISNEEYKRMFSLNPAYSTVGHGIQMFLCKKIIDVNKWEIRFQKKADECSFTISIPIRKNNQLKNYKNYILNSDNIEFGLHANSFF